MNFTSSDGQTRPEPRYNSAGGGVIEEDESIDIEGDSADSMLLWMSMGQNEVGRKLSDTWVLEINQSDPFLGNRISRTYMYCSTLMNTQILYMYMYCILCMYYAMYM